MDIEDLSEEEVDEFELARRQRRERKEAIAKTWGYYLYQTIVEFPSDVLSSLRNNISPPYSTLRSAQAFREEPASQVQRIDARILAIEQEMEALKKEKDALWKESKAYRTKLRGCDAVLSPIRRLPLDIIREIATHTLPMHPSPYINQSPLNISQTSSTWRTAAQSLPQLWSTVHVRVNLETSLQRARSQVVEFFIHAKKQPLSLSLFFDGTRGGSLSSLARKRLRLFLKDIGPAMQRLERLCIGAHDLGHIWYHLDLAKAVWNLESLKYLHTNNQDAFSQDRRSVIFPAAVFLNTPALTYMSSYGCFFTLADLGQDLIDSSSLTELYIAENLSVSGWADLLDICPRLQTGDFRIQTWDDSEPRPARTHEALQNLSLHIIHDNATATGILSQFQIPTLRVLRISSEEDYDALPPPASTFSSYAYIRYLRVSIGYDQHSIYLQDLLCETVNLEELVFTNCPMSFSTVFEAMTIKFLTPSTAAPAESNILPRLSTIRVQTHCLWTIDRVNVMNETSLYVDAFARMLNSRRPSQVPPGWQALRKVSFQPHHSEASSSAKSVTENLSQKTALAQLEGLVLRCPDSCSDEVLDWERDPPSHPFDEWLAPEI